MHFQNRFHLFSIIIIKICHTQKALFHKRAFVLDDLTFFDISTWSIRNRRVGGMLRDHFSITDDKTGDFRDSSDRPRKNVQKIQGWNGMKVGKNRVDPRHAENT